MSDTDQPQTPPPYDPPAKSPPRRRRRWLFAGGLGLAALAGLLTTRAWAHHHHFGRFGHVQSEADLRERLERGADFALSRVDATDLQRERVNAIMRQSAPGLFRAHQNGTALRRSLLQAVADGDSAQAESLRKQGVAWADELSRLMLSAVEQSLRVLDDAQRAKVREHLAHMADRHGRQH
jgi:Spy/CpxP family protein refolding chaperone